MRRILVIGCCGLGLAVPNGALAVGGPVPPVQGGPGVSVAASGARYVAVGVGRNTVIQRVRSADGKVDRSRRLGGSLGVPGVAYDGSTTGLSTDGQTLVLAEMIRNYPPTRTRLVVLDAPRLLARAQIALPGYYAVDAISPTGRWLYLIDYTSLRDNRYEVLAYDLRDRRLITQPVVDPRERGEAMRGVPVTRAMSADGRWAYTLYDRSGAPPFIHALDTQRRAAVCIDLPALAGVDLSGLQLRLGPAQGTLRIERTGVALAVVDTRRFAVGGPGALRASTARRGDASGRGGGPSWKLGVIPIAVLAALALVAWRRRETKVRATLGV